MKEPRSEYSWINYGPQRPRVSLALEDRSWKADSEIQIRESIPSKYKCTLFISWHFPFLDLGIWNDSWVTSGEKKSEHDLNAYHRVKDFHFYLLIQTH